MLFKIGITIASAGWMVLLLSVMATFIMDVRLIIFIGLGGASIFALGMRRRALSEAG